MQTALPDGVLPQRTIGGNRLEAIIPSVKSPDLSFLPVKTQKFAPFAAGKK
jgi:hypothetical protein